MDPDPGFWDQNLSRTYRESNYDVSIVNLLRICRESVVNLSQMPTAFSSLKNFIYENHGIWCEMGPYGSISAHIKAGRSPMALDHFQTPPDPKKGYKNSKFIPKDVKAARSAALNF